jgi:hypothetical protein
MRPAQMPTFRTAGGSADNSFTGAAWVYTVSGGVWTQQGGKLVGCGKVKTEMRARLIRTAARSDQRRQSRNSLAGR